MRASSRVQLRLASSPGPSLRRSMRAHRLPSALSSWRTSPQGSWLWLGSKAQSGVGAGAGAPAGGCARVGHGLGQRAATLVPAHVGRALHPLGEPGRALGQAALVEAVLRAVDSGAADAFGHADAALVLGAPEEKAGAGLFPHAAAARAGQIAVPELRAAEVPRFLAHRGRVAAGCRSAAAASRSIAARRRSAAAAHHRGTSGARGSATRAGRRTSSARVAGVAGAAHRAAA
jgi:hypothetical protein